MLVALCFLRCALAAAASAEAEAAPDGPPVIAAVLDPALASAGGPFRVRGLVVGAEPSAGQALEARILETDQTGRIPVAADGSFAGLLAAPLADGRFTVRLTLAGEGGVPAASLDLGLVVRLDLDLRLSVPARAGPGAPVRLVGAVRTADGVPLGGLLVRGAIDPEDGGRGRWTRTAGDGSFTLLLRAPSETGRHRLTVTVSEGASQVAEEVTLHVEPALGAGGPAAAALPGVLVVAASLFLLLRGTTTPAVRGVPTAPGYRMMPVLPHAGHSIRSGRCEEVIGIRPRHLVQRARSTATGAGAGANAAVAEPSEPTSLITLSSRKMPDEAGPAAASRPPTAPGCGGVASGTSACSDGGSVAASVDVPPAEARS